ncbi:glycoside hydrolase family 13 protein [Jiangella endophytica]|uniref:glycoside hydrolase family 13 protein n=1 Tax=Jiangella endophytica TaxID=1623398 RepID=UPI000E341AB5|nr:glycoside hydrolase family 13 protein [Jiangella endophytica]
MLAPSAQSPRPSSPPIESAGDDWWHNAVIYQVYLRSFQDSDGDGIGDLQGLRERLPYLRGLGVDGIWLAPFYPSPQHDHGYDVSDYTGVHSDYGTLADAGDLVGDAHRLGLRVVVDIVPNHCSVEHPWFAAAVAAEPAGPERQRFHFADGRGEDGELPPNNWRSIFGGSAWERVAERGGAPGQWFLHSFAPEQPDFNWRHPEVVAHFDRVLRFWFDLGVDGLRIDVAHGLHKRDRLPDHDLAVGDELTGDPVNPHAWNQREVHDVWRRWRAIADGYARRTGRARLLVGEVGLLDAEQLATYQRPGELHQSFYFDFLRAPWEAPALREVIDKGTRTVAGPGAPVAWVLNNHDMPRSVTRYAGGAPGHGAGDVALGLRRAAAAALLLLALPGTAYLYQGEELGLPEVTDLPDEALSDPVFHRTGGARRGRDGCRVPLPWSAVGDSFGFSPDGATPPWLPQPDWFARYTVERQLDLGDSMLQLYRAAIALRHRIPAMSSQRLRWISAEPGVLCFTRGDGFVCMVNCSSQPVRAPMGSLLIASDPETGEKVPADGAAWFLLPGRSAARTF